MLLENIHSLSILYIYPITAILLNMSIRWSKVQHRGAQRIKIEFPYNQILSSALRDEADARWSRTLKAWHVEDTPANIEKVLAIVTKLREQ